MRIAGYYYNIKARFWQLFFVTHYQPGRIYSHRAEGEAILYGPDNTELQRLQLKVEIQR
jgi:hypothetical protein